MNSEPTLGLNSKDREPTLYSEAQAKSPGTPLPDLDLDFYSIDEPVLDWRFKFPISMLRIGRIILRREQEVMNVSAGKVSRLMARHRNELPRQYTALQTRQELYKHNGEIRGGGIKIEWMESSNHRYRTTPHYDFNFSRILREEDYLKPEALNESVRM